MKGFSGFGNSPAKDMKTGKYEHSLESPAKHGTTDDFLYGRNGHNPDIMDNKHEDWHGDRIELTPEEKKEKGVKKQAKKIVGKE